MGFTRTQANLLKQTFEGVGGSGTCISGDTNIDVQPELEMTTKVGFINPAATTQILGGSETETIVYGLTLFRPSAGGQAFPYIREGAGAFADRVIGMATMDSVRTTSTWIFNPGLGVVSDTYIENGGGTTMIYTIFYKDHGAA